MSGITTQPRHVFSGTVGEGVWLDVSIYRRDAHLFARFWESYCIDDQWRLFSAEGTEFFLSQLEMVLPSLGEAVIKGLSPVDRRNLAVKGGVH